MSIQGVMNLKKYDCTETELFAPCPWYCTYIEIHQQQPGLGFGGLRFSGLVVLQLDFGCRI